MNVAFDIGSYKDIATRVFSGPEGGAAIFPMACGVRERFSEDPAGSLISGFRSNSDHRVRAGAAPLVPRLQSRMPSSRARRLRPTSSVTADANVGHAGVIILLSAMRSGHGDLLA
jgi:hypothetical protein